MTNVPVTFDIQTSDGHPVRADLYAPPGGNAPGIVVLCHGFKGSRTWGFLPSLSERLRMAGLAALSIDFSHNGRLPERTEGGRAASYFSNPELFRKNTISREFEDLCAVVRYIRESHLGDSLGRGASIGLFGHSRGGFVAILCALEKRGVQAICTWSTAAVPDSFTEHQRETWRRNGFYAFKDARDGTRLAIDVGYLDDLEANAERYSLVDRLHSLAVPHLIIHGSMDLAVPVEAGRALHEAETGTNEKRLMILKTGHTFGMAGASPGGSRQLEAAIEQTVRWYQRHLLRG